MQLCYKELARLIDTALLFTGKSGDPRPKHNAVAITLNGSEVVGVHATDNYSIFSWGEFNKETTYLLSVPVAKDAARLLDSSALVLAEVEGGCLKVGGLELLIEYSPYFDLARNLENFRTRYEPSIGKFGVKTELLQRLAKAEAILFKHLKPKVRAEKVSCEMTILDNRAIEVKFFPESVGVFADATILLSQVRL